MNKTRGKTHERCPRCSNRPLWPDGSLLRCDACGWTDAVSSGPACTHSPIHKNMEKVVYAAIGWRETELNDDAPSLAVREAEAHLRLAVDDLIALLKA